LNYARNDFILQNLMPSRRHAVKNFMRAIFAKFFWGPEDLSRISIFNDDGHTGAGSAELLPRGHGVCSHH